jgi:hypothetical protein
VSDETAFGTAEQRAAALDGLHDRAWRDLLDATRSVSGHGLDRALTRLDQIERIRDAERARQPQVWIGGRLSPMPNPVDPTFEHPRLRIAGWGPAMTLALVIAVLITAAVVLGEHFAR